MTCPGSTAPTRRSWFRFSFRTLLVFVALVAAWLAWTVHRVRTQRLALASIQSAGGNVMFEYHETGPRGWSTAGRPRGPQWLRNALGPEYFDRPTYVGLRGTPEDEKWIDAVNDLGSIKSLMLSGPHVRDTTLARLKPSRALLELHMTAGAVTDAGLERLSKFPNLRWLVLNETTVSDSGMAHLSRLRFLEAITLTNTNVSDASIPLILGLANLKQVDLRGTKVTAGGAKRISEQAPNLTLFR